MGMHCATYRHPRTEFPSLCELTTSWGGKSVECSLQTSSKAPECAFDPTPEHTHSIGAGNQILEHWSQIPSDLTAERQQTQQDIAHHIAAQETTLITIPWTSYHIDIFEAGVLQILCCQYPGEDTIPELEVFQGKVTDDFHTTYALGRRQRDRSDTQTP